MKSWKNNFLKNTFPVLHRQWSPRQQT